VAYFPQKMRTRVQKEIPHPVYILVST